MYTIERNKMNSTSAPNVFIMTCLIDNDALKFVRKFPTQFMFVSHVAACFCSALIMLTTVILNSLAFATIWSSPGLKKSTSLFLIMILAGTDAVSGLVSQLVFTLRLTSEIFGNAECWMHFAQKRSSIFMTIISCFMTVSVINIERYIGVIHPVFHHAKLQKST